MFRLTCLHVFPKQFLKGISVSFSQMPLKEELSKILKTVRYCNNAHKFCGLLINSPKALTESRSKFESSLSCGHFNRLSAIYYVRQLQSISKEEKPEYFLVDMISLVLGNNANSSDKASEIKPLLSRLLNYENERSSEYPIEVKYCEEYLRQLINTTERLINSYEEGSFYAKLVDSNYSQTGIENLQLVLFNYTIIKAGELLDVIFLIGHKCLQFSEKDKIEIGTLMAEAIIPIANYIELIDIFSEGSFKCSYLLKRSSLQFLIDCYAEFPAGSGALLKNFYTDAISSSINTLDSLISRLCYFLEVPSGKVGNEKLVDWVSDEDFEEAHRYEMPKSHTWWTKCSQKLKDRKNLLLH